MVRSSRAQLLTGIQRLMGEYDDEPSQWFYQLPGRNDWHGPLALNEAHKLARSEGFSEPAIDRVPSVQQSIVASGSLTPGSPRGCQPVSRGPIVCRADCFNRAKREPLAPRMAECLHAALAAESMISRARNQLAASSLGRAAYNL